MGKAGIWFAVCDLGDLWKLERCQDFDEAEQAATDRGINPLWLIDEETAKQWLEKLKEGFISAYGENNV